MNRATAITASLIPAVFLLGLSVSLSGIALTGPEQSFAIERGASKSSYLRVWNEGTETATIQIRATGPVADILTISQQSFELEPGKEARVGLLYVVPADFPTGSCQGSIEAVTVGGSVGASATRSVSVWVTALAKVRVLLSKGLNLISWPGPDVTLQEAFGTEGYAERVWMRKESGAYVFSRWFPAQGWWSSDPDFTKLRYGGAYFVECSAANELQISKAGGFRLLQLKRGLNLIGWAGDPMPVQDAFPQVGTEAPITKIWTRNPSGEYIWMQYFPEQGIWWSPDPSFTGLEPGKAYFVECRQDISLNVPG